MFNQGPDRWAPAVLIFTARGRHTVHFRPNWKQKCVQKHFQLHQGKQTGAYCEEMCEKLSVRRTTQRRNGKRGRESVWRTDNRCRRLSTSRCEDLFQMFQRPKSHLCTFVWCLCDRRAALQSRSLTRTLIFKTSACDRLTRLKRDFTERRGSPCGLCKFICV